MRNVFLGKPGFSKTIEPMLIPKIDIKNDTPQKGGKSTANIINKYGSRILGIIYKVNKHPEIQVRNGRFPTIKSSPNLRINTKLRSNGEQFFTHKPLYRFAVIIHQQDVAKRWDKGRGSLIL